MSAVLVMGLKTLWTPKPPCKNGGCDFPVEPTDSAPSDRIIWRPEAAKFTVLIGDRASGGIPCDPLDPRKLPDVTAIDEGEDGVHVRIGQRNTVQHVHFAPGRHWNAIIPEPGSRARRDAAKYFRRWLDGKASGPSPEGSSLTSERKSQLRRGLRLIDWRQAGMVARDMAVMLFDPSFATLSAMDLSFHSQRRKLRTWESQAQALVDGGYLVLLAGGWVPAA